MLDGTGEDGKVIIRRERPDEVDEIERVIRLAFDGRGNEAALVVGLRASPTFQPGYAVVAERDGVLIGHAMLSEVDLVGADGSERSVLALAPVSVLPQTQGQGVGSALIEFVLARADEAGAPLVVVLGDRRYYGRFEFEPATSLGISPPAGMPAEAFSVRRLTDYGPTWRGTVRFPPIFENTGTL